MIHPFAEQSQPSRSATIWRPPPRIAFMETQPAVWSDNKGLLPDWRYVRKKAELSQYV